MADWPGKTDSNERARLYHLEIGRLAMLRGWIDTNELCTALLQVPECSEVELAEVWADTGMVTVEQALELVDEVLAGNRTRQLPRVPSPYDDELLGEFDEFGDEASTQTIGHATLIHQPAAKRKNQRVTGPIPLLNPATSSIDETMLPQIPRSGSVSRSSGSMGQSSSWPSSPDHGVLDSADLQIRDQTHDDRYLIEEEIGRGGSGVVVRAFDRSMGRIVAMKVMRPRDGDVAHRLERFIDEARGTGRLEHPNIIPIYDVGVLGDGRAYYTMKLLRRHSLRQVLRDLGDQDETARKEYPTQRLLNIFLPVCQAMAYAHAQGVVHRDLKPDNIMLGDYGEVLVTDWGLARSLMAPAELFDAGGGRAATLGTPAYMPPEQAMGRLDLVDEISDIYCLGAILYEILTLRPPYDGPSALAVLEAVADGHLTPPSTRAPGRVVPPALEHICLKAMSARREDRFRSALELHDEIQGYIDGRQVRAAEGKVHLGRSFIREYFRRIDEIDLLDGEVRSLREDIAGWASPVDKDPLWSTEDSLERAWSQMARSYSDAVRAFTQALTHDSECDDARRGLAELYWSRFQLAETRKNVVDQVHYSGLVRQLDKENRFADLLDGLGSLTLTSHPIDAHLSLVRFRERNRVLEPWEPRTLGQAPAHLDSLEMGSYLAIVEHPNHATVNYPIQINRCGDWRGHIELPPPDAVPDAFTWIPAGPYISGGDPQARSPAPEHAVHVPSFMLATFPVTFGEYMPFLDYLQAKDPEEAIQRAPQARDGDGQLAEIGDDGLWRPKDILIEGDARVRYPHGEGHELRLPIISVDVFDALAYIAWRSELDGLAYRLPTMVEMEKAARGVDGRFFPWGDHFDPTFCKMRMSRPEIPQPEPIGTFETDTSVYGVRDLAGCVQTFVRDADWLLAHELEPSGEPIPGALPGERVPESCSLAGGAWNKFPDACRAASKLKTLSVGRSIGVGFRLALDPPTLT